MGKKTTGAKLEREEVKRYLQQYHAAKQKKRILEERRRTLSEELRGPSTDQAFRAIYAAVASMPENILDVLAVELRTPAYNQSFPIEVKRALIEGTLTFYARMGTPAACNQIIETIFGAGYIEEWFDYKGNPHHFRAYVGNGGQVNQADLAEFRRVLANVKRLSSWLDEVITISTFEEEILTFAGYLDPGYSVTTLPEAPMDYDHNAVAVLIGAVGSINTTTLPEGVVDMDVDTMTCGAFSTFTATTLPAAE